MITIATATLEDLAYVASWLCEADRKELALTRDPDDYVGLANDAHASLIHKVALLDGMTPVFAFGAHPVGIDGATVWGYKTDKGALVAKEVTKYIRKTLIPTLRAVGVVRASCLVHQDNLVSRRWLARLGFEPKATPGGIGSPLLIYQYDEANDQTLH